MSERAPLIGGEHDGVWLELFDQPREIAMPANRELATYLPGNLSTPLVYERAQIDLGAGQPPLVFYRLSTLTARQAVAWVLAGYGKGQ